MIINGLDIVGLFSKFGYQCLLCGNMVILCNYGIRDFLPFFICYSLPRSEQICIAMCLYQSVFLKYPYKNFQFWKNDVGLLSERDMGEFMAYIYSALFFFLTILE